MTDKTADIVIAGAARTPMGAFQGELAPLAAPELGGAAIAGAIRNAGLDKAAVDEVIMGCVLPAGLGQAPARQAALQPARPLAAQYTLYIVYCLTEVSSDRF